MEPPMHVNIRGGSALSKRCPAAGPAAAPPHPASPRRTIAVVGSGRMGASAPRHPLPGDRQACVVFDRARWFHLPRASEARRVVTLRSFDALRLLRIVVSEQSESNHDFAHPSTKLGMSVLSLSKDAQGKCAQCSDAIVGAFSASARLLVLVEGAREPRPTSARPGGGPSGTASTRRPTGGSC